MKTTNDELQNEALRPYRTLKLTLMQLMAIVAVSGIVLELVLRYLV